MVVVLRIQRGRTVERSEERWWKKLQAAAGRRRLWCMSLDAYVRV
jgi:hypothetical protein